MRFLILLCIFFLSGCARFFLPGNKTITPLTPQPEVEPPLKLLWEIKTPGLPQGGLVFHDGYILFACGTGHVAAIDLKSSDIVAKKKFGKSCARPPVADSSVFYQTYEMGDDGLIAYNFKKKKVLWKVEKNLSQSTPIEIGNKIYYQSIEGNVYCLDTISGEIIWKYSMAQKTLNALCPVASLIISAGLDGRIVALDTAGGVEQWQVNLSTRILADPVSKENLLYIAGYDGSLYILNIENGRTLAHKKFNVPLYHAPAFDNVTIYIPLSNGELIAEGRDNFNVHWTFKGLGPAAETPLVTSSYIYYTTLANQLYVIDKKDGSALQSVHLKGRPRSRPYIYHDHLYVVHEDKYVSAFIHEN